MLAEGLPRAVPESVGLSSGAIADFLHAVKASGEELHSFMVLRHGKVAAEGWWHPYRASDPHLLYSLSKSFTSTAAGFAVSEGLISLDDRVMDFFPDRLPSEIPEQLSDLKIRHLLSMSVGHETDDLSDLGQRFRPNWEGTFLARSFAYAPGCRFQYNSSATFMVAAILTRRTGMDLLSYLKPRLLDPLGITEARWERNPDGIMVGGWGMSVNTESIAKFGQLYLQNGMWNGKQLLPEGWVATATQSHISNGEGPASDWNQGYGFQFWRCLHNAYRGDGAFGQFCIVVPWAELVVAITGSMSDLQAVLSTVWDYLLPEKTGGGDLAGAISSLEIPGPEGDLQSELESSITGRFYDSTDPEFSIKSVQLSFSEDGMEVQFEDQCQTQRFTAGREDWAYGEVLRREGLTRRIAARFAWKSPNELVIRMRDVEEPLGADISGRFEGDRILVDGVVRSRFGGPEIKFEGSSRR